MKNLLRLGVLVIYALCIMQFQLGQIDTQFKTKSEIGRAGKLAKDETSTNTKTFKFGDLVKEKYGLEPADLASFYFNTVSIAFNDGVCAKLKSYSVTIKFPIGDKTISDATGKCVFPQLPAGAPKDAVMYFTSTEYGGDEFAKKVMTTDFIEMIRNNSEIIIEVKFTANEDIPAGNDIKVDVGVKFTVKPLNSDGDEPKGGLGC